ncbi:Hypothetical protein NTJ_02338 [Nesidiocoris tenuis]|nr:Hypothetical protein NTJ_02338 [Nesidiocoris tenuis]
MLKIVYYSVPSSISVPPISFSPDPLRSAVLTIGNGATNVSAYGDVSRVPIKKREAGVAPSCKATSSNHQYLPIRARYLACQIYTAGRKKSPFPNGGSLPTSFPAPDLPRHQFCIAFSTL